MYEELKKEVSEIIKIVKTCPENLQEKCFELLLSHYLSKHPQQGKPPETHPPTKLNQAMTAFLTQFTLTEAQLGKIFNISESAIQPLFSDLKVEKTAQKQIRLSLLLGIKHAIQTGEFRVPIEELREWCVDHGTYDPAHFATNLRNKKSFFTKLSTGEDPELSHAGKKAAAETVKEISA